MELEGKVALVTGASSGIGKAISLKLAEENAKVILLARSKEKLEKIKEEIETKGSEAFVAVADLRDEKQVEDAINKAGKYYNRIDILINNAGLGRFKEVQDMSIEDWDIQIDVMLRGAFLVTKFSLPYIYSKNSGHIINISSKWAQRYCSKCTGYTGAKFGLRGFTQSLREEARKHNVKVTNIMPGTVETPFFDKTQWEHDFSWALKPDDIASFIGDILKYPDRMVVEEALIESIHPDISTY